MAASWVRLKKARTQSPASPSFPSGSSQGEQQTVQVLARLAPVGARSVVASCGRRGRLRPRRARVLRVGHRSLLSFEQRVESSSVDELQAVSMQVGFG
jgi:hypothetical protein